MSFVVLLELWLLFFVQTLSHSSLLFKIAAKYCLDYELMKTCENSEELGFSSSAVPAYILIADLYGNATFKFRDDTVLRILDLGQLLDPGVAYYNIEIDYPDFEIETIETTASAYIGPMIT